MPPQFVSITIKYTKPGTKPPVYLAGSFSNWQPQEMQYTATENNGYEYSGDVLVEPGKEYQYKFRVGLGDWWMLNEDSLIVTDNIGNRNNLLVVFPQGEQRPETGIPPLTMEEGKPAPAVAAERTHIERNGNSIHATMGRTGCPLAYDETLTVETTDPGLSYGEETLCFEEATPAIGAVDNAATALDEETTTPDFLSLPLGLRDLGLDLDRVAPEEEKALLFDYECSSIDTNRAASCQQKPSTHAPLPNNDHPYAYQEAIDLNHPSLEVFPTDRECIFARPKSLGSRLLPNEAGENANHHQEPTISNVILGIPRQEESTYLGSIIEEQELDDESLTCLLNTSEPSNLAIQTHALESDQIIATQISNISPLANLGEVVTQQATVTPDIHSGSGICVRKKEMQTYSHLVVEKLKHCILNGPETAETNPESVTQLAMVHTKPTTEIPEACQKILSRLISENFDGFGTQQSQTDPSPVTLFGRGARQLGYAEDPVQDTTHNGEGPSITIQLATPRFVSTKTRVKDPFIKPFESARATTFATENGRSVLKSRTKQSAPSGMPERPITPSSMRSSNKDMKSRNFLKAFWRVVFVDWIGGVIMRLCGGRSRK